MLCCEDGALFWVRTWAFLRTGVTKIITDIAQI